MEYIYTYISIYIIDISLTVILVFYIFYAHQRADVETKLSSLSRTYTKIISGYTATSILEVHRYGFLQIFR